MYEINIFEYKKNNTIFEHKRSKTEQSCVEKILASYSI